MQSLSQHILENDVRVPLTSIYLIAATEMSPLFIIESYTKYETDRNTETENEKNNRKQHIQGHNPTYTMFVNNVRKTKF